MRFIILLAVASFVSFASNVETVHAAQKKKSAPCDGDFELKIEVTPLDPQNGDKVGLSLKVPKGGRGLASRTHTGQSNQISARSCALWQKNTWQSLDRIFFENSRGERRDVVCHNVATLNYRLGREKKSAKMCLSGARDGLTYGFGKFYEGTDLLIER